MTMKKEMKEDKALADYIWTKKERLDHSKQVVFAHYEKMRTKQLDYIDKLKKGELAHLEEIQVKQEERLFDFYIDEYINSSIAVMFDRTNVFQRLLACLSSITSRAL